MTGGARRARNLRNRAGAAGWIVGLGLAAVVLEWAGQGPLAAPPLADPGRWTPWLEARGPIVAAFALVRVAALAALWYVVGATTLGVALRMAGAASLVRITDRVTIGPVRRMLAGSVSLGLAASGLVAVAAPTMRTAVAAAAQEVAPPRTSGPPATVTMHRLSPSGPSIAAPAAPSTERWTVKPGDCFWSIADDVLTARWGRSPTDAEIVPFWRRLVDANRHQLAHGGHPDLVFPGQVFEVPAP